MRLQVAHLWNRRTEVLSLGHHLGAADLFSAGPVVFVGHSVDHADGVRHSGRFKVAGGTVMDESLAVEEHGWLSRHAIGLGMAGLAVCLVGWVAVCVFWAPYWFVHENRYNTTTDEQALEDKSLSDVRANLLTATAGLAIIATGYFTWRRIGIEEDQANSAREQVDRAREQVAAARDQAAQQAEASRLQLDLTQEGQITERYTKAVEQLGDQDNLTVRLGAIYALERLAKDSDARRAAAEGTSRVPQNDRATIEELLTTFCRQFSHVRLDGADAESTSGEDGDDGASVRPDVSAILTVLGRLGDPPPYDLRMVMARQANLMDAKFEQVDLEGANLEGANLEGADLEWANLTDAKLGGANLERARLQSASLVGADLHGANLQEVYLGGADLQGANLQGAYLWVAYLGGADIAGANLEGANLEGANLESANLAGVRYDEFTTWPAGFTPPS